MVKKMPILPDIAIKNPDISHIMFAIDNLQPRKIDFSAILT